MKTIGICSDHAGYEIKQFVKLWIEKKGWAYKDFGTFSQESMDYTDVAHPMAEAIEKGEFEVGISICGSGNGISMTLNKHAGIRAALCWNKEIAKLAKTHNNANVLSLPGRFISINEAEEMLEVFFSSEFEGGRHQRRIDKIPIA
ncbi:MAG: ribose 5-phosphate isomerase B [Bacteroides sp.]|nr:ribose 5-phosphate isomerase B [Bacteroides sp.]MDD4055273.1 ribose 5-phosphate isomerase B [Bacteroides sp.]MDD4720372.1 ribose 5-phosphate isomerase B [Bacteroides sp.]